ncbi:MAG TPA: glycosyltransferase family 1 protein [Bryobacteraceae bacterium]|jgi:glycosyltransferase involved in cell wall biosynthesis|nr:glycosyltransferase family 1 protein [Bryobacteraceae bacterium]
MRFSVDAHAIGCHLTGNEVYIRNLLHEFARLDRSSDFIAYVSKPGAHLQVPESIRTSQVSENPFRRLGLDLPMKLRYDRPDLLHVQYTSPIGCRVPLVVSVHDVSYLEHPQYFTRFRSTQLRWTVKRTVQAAARILTPSEFSRRAILRHYKIDERKVVVVPNAVSSSFRPVERESAAAIIEEKFGIRGPFVLTVGDLQPRKNHLGLLHAFEETLRQHPHLPHRLVFVGKETWYSKELHRAVLRSNVAGRVDFTGFVEDPDLLHFYGACHLFVFPSFYEGFGLPILEAMACGRAVACSSATAMPEVANAAGILFDPYSVPEMARAIGDVLLDDEMRVRLERLGTHRAAQFTWERAAQKTLDVYYDVAGVSKAVPALKVRASSSS